MDLEQVMQSDTWALATPEVRPWLLMLWTTAWQQVPCGSMPSEDALIMARLGIPPKLYSKAKAVLLRGWWLAEDGRLYHDTIASRVHDMVSRKDGERQRKAEYRARKEAELKLAEVNAGESQDVPPMSHGTDTGQTWESHGSDATGTSTGTGLDSSTPPPTRAGGTKAGQICRAMRQQGLADGNPSNPTLVALIEAGATEGEFVAAAKKAAADQKGFNYALGIVTGERKRAAVVAQQILHGELPATANASYAQQAADIARTTVPAKPGPDPTLARLKADDLITRPPKPEERQKLDEVIQRMRA